MLLSHLYAMRLGVPADHEDGFATSLYAVNALNKLSPLPRGARRSAEGLFSGTDAKAPAQPLDAEAMILRSWALERGCVERDADKIVELLKKSWLLSIPRPPRTVRRKGKSDAPIPL